MQRYKNISGRSGVDSFEIDDDLIKVKFSGSENVYIYDGYKPGAYHVAQMKLLAILGEGLTTYINQYVRNNYHLIK